MRRLPLTAVLALGGEEDQETTSGYFSSNTRGWRSVIPPNTELHRVVESTGEALGDNGTMPANTAAFLCAAP